MDGGASFFPEVPAPWMHLLVEFLISFIYHFFKMSLKAASPSFSHLALWVYGLRSAQFYIQMWVPLHCVLSAGVSEITCDKLLAREAHRQCPLSAPPHRALPQKNYDTRNGRRHGSTHFQLRWALLHMLWHCIRADTCYSWTCGSYCFLLHLAIPFFGLFFSLGNRNW